MYLLNEAYKDSYDHAFLISRDSDLAPAINLVKSTFPEKIVTVVAPPFYNHSFELMHAAHSKAKININQLERSLLPEKVFDSEGHLAASRPSVYEPSLCLAVKS